MECKTEIDGQYKVDLFTLLMSKGLFEKTEDIHTGGDFPTWVYTLKLTDEIDFVLDIDELSGVDLYFAVKQEGRPRIVHRRGETYAEDKKYTGIEIRQRDGQLIAVTQDKKSDVEKKLGKVEKLERMIYLILEEPIETFQLRIDANFEKCILEYFSTNSFVIPERVPEVMFVDLPIEMI